MYGVMANIEKIEASCAICGSASTNGECIHEGQSLQRALNEAIERWEGMQDIREWVLNHARYQVIQTFEQLKQARKQAHYAYLQTIPCYTLYQRYRGNPPLQPAQLHLLQSQIGQAQAIFQAGVDEDWRRSCLRYPEVLDYYLSLVEIRLPNDTDPGVQEPRFGVPLKGPRRIKARRDSVDSGMVYKKKTRRNSRSSRGRTPPAAPMADAFRR